MLPPKMGEGVSGLSVGSVHLGASSFLAAAAAASARTTTLLRRRGAARTLLAQRADCCFTDAGARAAALRAMVAVLR